jgi:uncharacterized repeat protein (TIGR02543 family)
MRALLTLLTLVFLPALAAALPNGSEASSCPNGVSLAACATASSRDSAPYTSPLVEANPKPNAVLIHGTGEDAAALFAANGVRAFTTRSARYTKIANDGSALPDSAILGSGPADWACTRDEVTGLVWEVKTTAGGARDLSQTYTHFDDPAQAQKRSGSIYINPTQGEIDAASNSTGWVNAVNASALCGQRDWKMPSLIELEALVDIATVPAINPTFFPNTQASEFWSASPDVEQPHNAWSAGFSYGYSYSYYRGDGYYLRLVRGGAVAGNFALSLMASGTGSGTLTSSSGGINCTSSAGTTSGTCSAPLASGSTVTLNATPAAGNTFTGWSGACSGTSTSCTVTMAAAKSVTARFNLALLSPQSIAFGAAPTGVIFAGSGVVSAIATSGLDVIFSSNTPAICSLVGHTLTGVSAGTCTVAANQPGNSTYSAAPQVTQNIAVGKASQTVSFDTLPILVFGGSGLVSASTTSALAAVLSSSTPAVCALSGHTLTGVSAGICTLTANQPGNANYHAAPQVTQNIAVGKAHSTSSLSASPASPALIGQAITLTARVSGSAGVLPTGSVVFKDAGVTLATAAPLDTASGTATYSSNAFAAGAHSFSARYVGNDAYLLSDAGPINYEIAPLIATTTALRSNPNPSQAEESVTVTASVTPVSHGGTLGGTVEVSGDGQSCRIALPEVSCRLVFARKGVKKLTASYSGDGDYAASLGLATHFVGQRPSLTPILLLLLD